MNKQERAGQGMSVFDREKARVLDKADLSRKGSVDAPIRHLVEAINTHPHYYTTSSCSGRTVVLCEEQGQRKKGCHWLLVSHDPITIENLTDVCTEYGEGEQGVEDGYTYLKFEPFVLHVMCRGLEHAQAMLQGSVGAGFRNSGISCGRKGKVMLAVRASLSLEVPLCHGRQLLVTKEYLGHLVKLCNSKFLENSLRIDRFYQQLKALNSEEKISASTSHPSCVKSNAMSKATRENGQSKDEELSAHRTTCTLDDTNISDEQLLCFGTLFEP